MNFGKESVLKKHKALVSTPKKFTTKMMIYGFKALVFLVVLCVCGIGFFGLGMIKGIIDTAPSIDDINIAPVGQATTIYDADGNQMEKLVTDGSNRIPVSLDRVPECLRYAFIDIEDERFEKHNGIDMKGILRAMVSTAQGDSQGASTITQQLLKNNVFEDGGRESNNGALIRRKIQEIYLALQLEKNYSKDIILENYLNTINLGSGNYGVQAAANRYFNKDVSELNVSESAVIAAITQNPSKYTPISHPEENAKRREKVLYNMKKNGHITQEEYDAALADNVYDRIHATNTVTDDKKPYSYFTDAIIEQVIEDLQERKAYTPQQAANAVYSGGLQIYSTQDAVIQRICDEETKNPDNYPNYVYYSGDWEMRVEMAREDENGNKYITYTTNKLIQYHRKVLGENDFKMIFSTEEDMQKCIDEYKSVVVGPEDKIVYETNNVSLQPQVSFTVMDQKTGYVKAIVGGRGDKNTSRSLNRATDSTRQPGSCFKVLAAYAPALDRYNYSLATVVEDSELYYSNGKIVNNWWENANASPESRTYRGLRSIRYAIANSMNVMTVKVLKDITPEAGYEYLKEFGFTTLVDGRTAYDGVSYESDINESLALGGLTDGVTNLELCAAYAAIANGGKYTEPVFYTKVLDSTGKVILENEPEKHQVIKETTAYLLTSAMHSVVTEGTGTKANVSGMYVAGKTGTSTNNYDIWFAGYTPYLTAAIWSGFDENKDISKATGSTSYHNALWSKIMTRIDNEKGYEYAEFSRPDDIVEVQVCSKSGMLPVEGVCDHDPEGSTVVTELFEKGTEPTEQCKAHVQYKICRISGLLATAGCQEVNNQVYRVRFLDTAGTTQDTPFLLPDNLVDNYCNIHK